MANAGADKNAELITRPATACFMESVLNRAERDDLKAGRVNQSVGIVDPELRMEGKRHHRRVAGSRFMAVDDFGPGVADLIAEGLIRSRAGFCKLDEAQKVGRHRPPGWPEDRGRVVRSASYT